MNAQEKKELILQIVPVKYYEPNGLRIYNAWLFVTKYYPDYDHSQAIADADDLQKLLDGEINGCAEDLLNRDYGGDINNPQIQIDYNQLHVSIYEKAIENFLESFKQYAQ